MSSKHTLGKEERLKSRKLIEGLFRDGRGFSLFPFRVFYALGVPPQDGIITANLAENRPLQAGFGVSSKHFKKAVDRNRIKRLTREAYRLQKGVLADPLKEKKGALTLFLVYTGKEIPDYHLMMEKMGLILQRLAKEIGV